jgi:hypothetical protein
MSVMIQCPTCGVPGRLPDSASGRVVRCPKCNHQWQPGAPRRRQDTHDADAPAPGWNRSRLIVLTVGVVLFLGAAVASTLVVVLTQRRGAVSALASQFESMAGATKEEYAAGKTYDLGDVRLRVNCLGVDRVILKDKDGNAVISKAIRSKLYDSFRDDNPLPDEIRRNLTGAATEATPEKYLSFIVAVGNNSSTRKIDYESWAGTSTLSSGLAKLTDNFGNAYKPVFFSLLTEFAFHTGSTSIHPREMILDGLVFEAPVREAKSYMLELPPAAFGGSGQPLRFRIPARPE